MTLANDPIMGNGELILIVDDDELIRRICKRLLEKGGYRVLEAESGKDAVRLFSEQQQDIDAVMVDFMMPGMDGIEVIQAIWALRHGTPVIMVSGFTKESLKGQKGIAEIHFIYKPRLSLQLLQVTSEALQQRKGQQAATSAC